MSKDRVLPSPDVRSLLLIPTGSLVALSRYLTRTE